MNLHDAQGSHDYLSIVHGSNLNDVMPTWYDHDDFLSINGC